MAKVYCIKESFDVKEFEELGYVFFPEQLTIAKIVKQPLNGKAVESLLDRYYRNPRFIEEVYKNSPDYFIKELGLRYNKNGQPRMTKKFKELITSWIIEIEIGEDGWVGFTSSDKYDSNVFYNCSVLDYFCAEEIEILKKHNLIEEKEIED